MSIYLNLKPCGFFAINFNSMVMITTVVSAFEFCLWLKIKWLLLSAFLINFVLFCLCTYLFPILISTCRKLIIFYLSESSDKTPFFCQSTSYNWLITGLPFPIKGVYSSFPLWVHWTTNFESCFFLIIVVLIPHWK